MLRLAAEGDGDPSMATVASEIELDLSGYVEKGQNKQALALPGELAPPKTFIDCLINVSEIKEPCKV